MNHHVEAVVFAAGKGTRLGELGASLPKALLPVWRDSQTLEPILFRVLRQARAAGVAVARVVVNHSAEHVERVVRGSAAFAGLEIEFVPQAVLDGEAGGIFLSAPPARPLLAVDVDNYIADDLFFRRLVEEYFSAGCVAAIGVHPVPDITRYANVKVGADGVLLDIVEKPDKESAFGDLAKMGCYVLSPELVARGRQFFQDSKGDITTTAAFSNACGLGEPIRCVTHHGYYLDIGTLDAYLNHLLEGGAPHA